MVSFFASLSLFHLCPRKMRGEEFLQESGNPAGMVVGRTHESEGDETFVQQLSFFVVDLVEEGHLDSLGHFLDEGMDGKEFVVMGGPFVLDADFDDGHHDTPVFDFLIRHAQGTDGFGPGYLVKLGVVAIVDIAHLVHVGITGPDFGFKVVHNLVFCL